MDRAHFVQSAVMTVMMLCAGLSALVPKDADPSVYFEGRCAFAEESCDKSTNWTMLCGGNFISEDLTGS